MFVPDLTFRKALQRRLGRLTLGERLLVLTDALRLPREALPHLAPPEQRVLTLQIAAALDAAGCHAEAAALRLSVGGGPLAGQQERRHCGRRWSDPLLARL